MTESRLPVGGKPLVSIVSPSLNQAQYIEGAISSVLEQDYPCIEYIVVDGCSTDGTLDILKRYKHKVSWISEPDSGQSEAINKGLRMAKGEIIGILYGVDDAYQPGAVRTAVEYLQMNPEVDMVHGPGQFVDSGGNIIISRRGGDASLKQLIAIDTIMDSAVFFRRKVLEEVGYIDESLHYVMAWEYWVRIAAAGFRIKYIPDPIFVRACEHPNSKTMMVKERFWQERARFFDELFSAPDTPAHILALKDIAYSGIYASSAHFYLRYGQFSKVLPALWKAFRTWPGVLFMYSPWYVVENLIEVAKANLYSIRKGETSA